MKKNSEISLKNEDFELLRTGINDNANLLNDDVLSEIFGGYCSSGYCGGGYESGDTKCKKAYCPQSYS